MCARCHLAPPRPGRTRCEACAALDRAESLARYYRLYRRPDTGPRGGARTAGPRVRVEREGAVVRVECRCGWRCAGTWDREQAAELVAGHRCPMASRRRVVRRQQLVMA